MYSVPEVRVVMFDAVIHRSALYSVVNQKDLIGEFLFYYYFVVKFCAEVCTFYLIYIDAIF